MAQFTCGAPARHWNFRPRLRRTTSSEEANLDQREERQWIEGALFASAHPVTAKRLSNLIPGCETKTVHAHIRELNEEYEAGQRAFRIERVAGGYQLRTVESLAPMLRALRPAPPLRLSGAALETLSIVAYRQPITRAEVEHIRGVEAGPVLRSLLERQMVRVAGHREVPGRPMLYATTRRFLEVLGLNSLSDLPTLREMEELLAEYEAAQPEDDNADAISASGSQADDATESGEADADSPNPDGAAGPRQETGPALH